MSIPAAKPEPSPNAWAESFAGIVTAFMMALVFRAFVIEGFEIPTGSMAPTLRGQHTQWISPQSGEHWAIGPWYNDAARNPIGWQGMGYPAWDSRSEKWFDPGRIRVSDPQTEWPIETGAARVHGGDRVFILKYLWPLYTPSRYDVVVFKNPRDPAQNYIKRLVGLGPEELAIVDGDVFSRHGATPSSSSGEDTWSLSGWKITRRPEAAQRAVWQPVYDSSFAPVNPQRDGRTWFRSPWVPSGDSAKSWTEASGGKYEYKGTGPGTLSWDGARRAIDDSYAYDQYPNGVRPSSYPVSDVRIKVGVRPREDGMSCSTVLKARKHEFRADIQGAKVTLRMRPDRPDGQWQVLSEASLANSLLKDRVTDVDFWHYDQSLKVFVDGSPIASGEYDWTIQERIANSMDVTLDQVWTSAGNLLTASEHYQKPQVNIDVGGACELVRVGLSRDLHYQAADYPAINDPTPWSAPGTHSRAAKPAAATHPRTPIFLKDGEFFFCGDNSPQSLDARLWDVPNPWMARMEPQTGVVTRDALIGRAFVVYWPGTNWVFGAIPVPDTGRIRQVN